MAITTVIFGPTGGVGSAAALFAHKKGAKVYLAMRDPSKTIPGLSESEEKSGNYVRVQADLNKPDTVLAAAKESGAKTAFFYLTWGAEAALAESIKAMKQGGIENVVFLSSYSVEGDIREVPRDHTIPYLHAQIEIALEETYGEGHFTALRPAWFATNAHGWIGEMKQGGPVHELYPDNDVDVIVPSDIGSVGGALLVKESGPFPRIVDLTGPQLISMRSIIHKIAEANGKKVEIVEIGEDEKLKRITEHGIPEPVAKYLVKGLKDAHEGDDSIMLYKGPRFDEAQKGVEKYTGEPATTVDQWVAKNKGTFA